MSTKNNPGPNSCFEKAEPDEPYFALIGRDACAPLVILFWCKVREIMGKDQAQIEDAMKCMVEFRDWAVKLGKGTELLQAYEAFRRACFEVAKAELEASKEVEPGNPETAP